MPPFFCIPGMIYMASNPIICALSSIIRGKEVMPLKCAFLAVWLCFAVIPAFADEHKAVAPDFTLHDLTGKKVRLRDFKGKAIILNFWSTSCSPCVAEIPALNALYHDLKASGLVVIGISVDPAEKTVREFVERKHIEYPVLMDTSQEIYFDEYGLFGLPVNILIDRSGMIKEKLIGQIDWLAPEVKKKINNALKGR
jgi:peroxiredoxin